MRRRRRMERRRRKTKRRRKMRIRITPLMICVIVFLDHHEAPP
jgi:hypothetical protein